MKKAVQHECENAEDTTTATASPYPYLPPPVAVVPPAILKIHAQPQRQSPPRSDLAINEALAELNLSPSPSRKAGAKERKPRSPAPKTDPVMSHRSHPPVFSSDVLSLPSLSPQFSFSPPTSNIAEPTSPGTASAQPFAGAMFKQQEPPPQFSSLFSFNPPAPLPVPLPLFNTPKPVPVEKPKPSVASKEEISMRRIAHPRSKGAATATFPRISPLPERTKAVGTSFLGLLPEATLVHVLRLSEGVHETRLPHTRVFIARLLASPENSLRSFDTDRSQRVALYELWPLMQLYANLQRLTIAIPPNDCIILTQEETEQLAARQLDQAARAQTRDTYTQKHRVTLLQHILLDLPSLTWLSLTGSYVTADALVDITKNTTLTFLDLRFNLLDALACEYLSQNTTILTLDVRSNPIGEAGLANLAGSLRLQTLAVGPVASHTLPAFPFPSSLLRNSLTSLRIEYTRMKANEALQGLDSLMRHSSLTYLELVHCGFKNGELSSEILNASKLVHFSLIDQGINADVSCTNPSLISLHLPYSCRISAAPPNLYYTSHYHVLANVRLRLEQLKRDRENIFRLALALAMERARLNSTCLLSRLPVDLIVEVMRHTPACVSSNGRDLRSHVTYVFRHLTEIVTGIKERQRFLDDTPLKELLLTREPAVLFW